MHILVSTTTASDLAETAEQSIDYLQKIVDYMISKAHILISALIILIVKLVGGNSYEKPLDHLIHGIQNEDDWMPVSQVLSIH